MMTLFADALQRHPLATGLVGTASSVGASSLSLLQDLDLFIRVAGGLIGLAIGLLTLVIQIRNLVRKKS